VAWYQHNAGVEFPLFEKPKVPVTYSDLRMLPSLRSFLASINASFKLDMNYVVPTQREGDRHIMDIARESNMFQEAKLSPLNYCRLYMGATTISDLTSPAGIHLAPDLSFSNTTLPSTDRIHRAHQSRPHTLFWMYWLRFLRSIAYRRGKLKQPLGNWQHPGSRLRRTWHVYYDQQHHRVYHRSATGYIQYDVFDTCCISGIPVTWTPTDMSVPVALEETSKDCWSLTAPPSPYHPPIRKSPPTTFKAYIRHLPQWEQHLFSNLCFHTSPMAVMELLHPTEPNDSDANCTLYFEKESKPKPSIGGNLVSDGSERVPTMTFGWSLCTTYGKRLVTCGGPGFGPSSSHRAEGTGMLSGGIKCLYQHLSHCMGLPLPNDCHLFSDNKGLLLLRTRAHLQYVKNYPNATLAPDWNLIEEIYETLRTIASEQPHFKPSIKHIKGHQDDHAEYADLSLEAQMNVDADHEAENTTINRTSVTIPSSQ
jgi:hypothetical protein